MNQGQLREGLPPMPARIAALPVDARGYPVPYFVADGADGQPDHRIMDASKLPRALKFELCWICGQKLGANKAFVIGPMCSITRTISEPPSHRECALWSARACPFLTRPMAKRRAANLPDDVREPAGDGLKRNPGAVCVWVTRGFKTFRDPRGGKGLLFDIGAEPVSTTWIAEGREATRAEVVASISSGLPLLQVGDDPDEQHELLVRLAFVHKLLDEVFGLEA